MSVNPTQFRKALGCFATGITVVSTQSMEKTLHGLTVNSFGSVSLDPPLVSFCLGSQSRHLEAFQKSQCFGVSVLKDTQQHISDQFANPNANPFDEISWHTEHTGAPVLDEALAQIDCQTVAVHEAGDHHLFIGEVCHVSYDLEALPLLYFQGQYQLLSK